MTMARAKSANDDTPVPPPRILPGMSPSLARIAARVARHARPLLLTHRAMLLSVTCDTRDERAPLSTCLWDERCALILRRPMRETGMGPQRRAGLEIAASMLLTNLIDRWPANAIPPAVGIVTDGDGVAFSSDHPSPMSPDWLAQHQASLCPTTTLLPFRPDGPWARMTAPNRTAFLH